MSDVILAISELLEGEGYNVRVENGVAVITDDSDVDAYLAVQGDQIIVESLLFPRDSVADVSALNDEILRTHQLVPLTSVGITTLEGADYYTAFGALSTDSKLESVLVEVDTLYDNISGILETFAPYIS